MSKKKLVNFPLLDAMQNSVVSTQIPAKIYRARLKECDHKIQQYFELPRTCSALVDCRLGPIYLKSSGTCSPCVVNLWQSRFLPALWFLRFVDLVHKRSKAAHSMGA